MIELIPSKQVRDYIDEINFEFTDHQMATLIWNARGYTYKQRIDALKSLGENTTDQVTKEQINQRIAYEEEALKRFKSNPDNNFIYVVNNEDGYSCGFFRKYDTALAYANKLEEKCEIEKQLIVEGDSIPIVKERVGINQNLCPDVEKIDYYEYKGHPEGEIELDEKGEILRVWSREMTDEEEDAVDEYKKERFEFQFINIPFPPTFTKGIPVKYIPSGEYGIIEAGSDIWGDFTDRISKGLYVDYSDMSIIVQFLGENGRWCHSHINPIDLEVGMPDIKEEPELYRAMDALSEYWSGKENAEHEEMVIKYSREYGRNHQEKLDADTATKLEDIMF